MNKYFCKGRLTIRAALYLSAFFISLVMGFSAPVTTVFFMSHVSPGLVATFSIVLKLCGIFVSYVKQSEAAVRWISQNFLPLMIGCEAVFLVLALIGEMHPEIRYVGYNMICVVGIKLLQVVRKDNISNCLKGTSIITFNSTCDTWGLSASFIGAALCSLALELFGNLNITLCMFIELVGCGIGHGFQVYANKRILEDIRPELKSVHVTFSEALNDICQRKKDKRKKSDDSIFDQ